MVYFEGSIHAVQMMEDEKGERMIFLGIPILDASRYEHANRHMWTTVDFSVTFLSWVTTQCWTQECELDFYAMGWEL